MYAALDVHTDHTIKAGKSEIKLFEGCLKVSAAISN
jgi:hypothetical protein